MMAASTTTPALPFSAANSGDRDNNNNNSNNYGNRSKVQTLRSLHIDYVHDIAFDHYGRRIATCSGDRTVKVWDLSDNGEWTFRPGTGSEWSAHRGSVCRLSWAHPEFGQLLATCGTDHAVTVWEERESSGLASSLPVGGTAGDTSSTSPGYAPGAGGSSAAAATRWVSKATLTDARRAVTCLEFAPRHLGLRLATGSADGVVRIYEAIDVMNLNHWPMNTSIDVEDVDGSGFAGATEATLGVSCLSWCTGKFEPPTLVVGGSSGRVVVYRYSDASRQWGVLLTLPGHSRGVLDVSWSPNVGRSYHLVASCGKDGILRVYRLKRGRYESKTRQTAASSSSLELEKHQVLEKGTSEVWRCQWNITGTVLASSGDGGVVRLWKSDFRNEWKCVSELRGDVSPSVMSTT